MKVLLIQHQSHTRRLFRHLLTRQHCAVVECDSFESAVGEMGQGPYSLVFVDEPLPDVAPLEPIRKLRSDPSTADSLIVALIDRNQGASFAETLGAGANDYVVLPGPFEEIQLRVDVLVGMAARVPRRPDRSEINSGMKERFFDRSPDAAVLLDRKGTILEANRRMGELTSYRVNQLVGQPAEFIGLPMTEEIPQLLERATAGGDRLEQVTLVRRDMKPVAAEIRYAWLDPESRTVIIGVAREIPSPEADVAGTVDAGGTSDEDAEVGFLEFNRQGMVVEANASMANLLRSPRELIVGTNLGRLIHREDLAEIAEILKPRSSSGRKVVGGALRMKSGRRGWTMLRIVGSAITGRDGQSRFRLQVQPDEPSDASRDQAVASAGVDPITGLLDRDGFVGTLESAFGRAGRKTPVYVLFLNIDRFKSINEQFGYAAGDEFMAAFGKRLAKILSDGDSFARIDGDEFAILPGKVQSHAQAMEFAGRISEYLANRPVVVNGVEQYMTASIGIAMSEPGMISPAELLRRADSASARAKRGGRAKIRMYESSAERIESDSLHLEQDLLKALKREELAIYYQPEVDLTTGAIVGVEALVRWNHPSKGFISPAQFIPTAETSGLIDPLGLWVLEQAASDVSAWISRFKLQDFNLSVNYSVNQFVNDNLITELSSALRRARLSPSSLRLEITESVLIDDDPEILKRLAQIKRLGAQLAIDDFGTGRASLNYLRTLPVDYLKVDRSFVSGASAESGELSLTRSIAGLARQSGLQVIVEGIESASQLERVRDIGCDRGQGYYFSRPVTAETIEFLLTAGPYPFAGMIGESLTAQAPSSNTVAS